jgi:hypothetical protein
METKARMENGSAVKFGPLGEVAREGLWDAPRLKEDASFGI